ncbi:4a-hydroxytetrahydrobiopterin dehydratase [Paracoccus sp. (in: a-proteobacteria)]|uniref:4a-hydroxytetrahydrobiopterin dehydratase n=1 Tax=Paracoccus sp. TaxID=267 RepID=UPI002899F362|nr:4a-hydroxytetrahydrobiopterin dehydratase [Paracoccus sp. (in: a-proteobacteria)]
MQAKLDLLHETIVNGAPLLPAETVTAALAGLEGWMLCEQGRAIELSLSTKSFLRAQALAMLAGGIGECANHHPDISFGWGYCRVRFTTHSAQGLTLNDLICAARLNVARQAG